MGGRPVADVVYSWGVLHHTGAMWSAIDAAAGRTAPGGQLFVALYNDQGPLSELWAAIKYGYGRLPRALRLPYAYGVGAVYFASKAAAKVALYPARWFGRGDVRSSNREAFPGLARSGSRGMSRSHDLIDWVGGWPFEVATPGEVVARLGRLGFSLELLETVGGRMGCNEFVFRRTGGPGEAPEPMQ